MELRSRAASLLGLTREVPATSNLEVFNIFGLRMTSRPQHLGHDIWYLSGSNNPSSLKMNGHIYHRFLDHLFIKSSTNALSIDQIMLINRFREARLESDEQFNYWRCVRRIFADVIAADAIQGAIEIGPGKFPLSPEGFHQYVACEIDPVANEYNRSKGLLSAPATNLLDTTQDDSIQLIFGIFAFHLNIGNETYELINRKIASDGIIIYNVLSQDARIRTDAMCRLSALSFALKGIDLLPHLGKEDILYVGTKGQESARLRRISDVVNASLISDS